MTEPFYRPGHVASPRPLEHAPDSPVWALIKDRHVAEARVRDVPQVGLELRFLVDGDLVHSQRCHTRDELDLIASLKRDEFLGRGWADARP